MAIKRRKPASSQYVHLDDRGVLSVRVPPDCVNWDQEFRLRLSKFWLRPGQIIARNKFLEDYVDNKWSDKVYKISGVGVRVYYKVGEIAMPKNAIIVNATVVERVDTGIGIEVIHSEYPFRNLQVYEFLNDLEIGGVPPTKRVTRSK